MPWTLRNAATSTMSLKVLKKLWRCGSSEIVEDGRRWHVPGRLHGQIQGGGIRAACVPEKSKHGIATPKPDLNIIRERLKVAEQLIKEMRDA